MHRSDSAPLPLRLPCGRPARPRQATRLLLLALLVIAPLACSDGRALRDPTPEHLSAVAPDSFTVRFATSAGDFEVRFIRAWSPLGVDRVYHLARHGFHEGARLYRNNPRVVQFGYSGDPVLDSVWRAHPIADEPVVATNRRGAVAFARGGPDTRDFQLFINRIDNPDYDDCCGGGYPPLGRITEGFEVIDRLYGEYGELEPGAQARIFTEGNGYLRDRYPLLDSIVSVRVVR